MKELNPEFKKIVIEIERMRHEMDMTRASINSWLLNLRDPKADREYLNMYIERLTEDLNTQVNLPIGFEDLIKPRAARDQPKEKRIKELAPWS